jgi:hypothetical protein
LAEKFPPRYVIAREISKTLAIVKFTTDNGTKESMEYQERFSDGDLDSIVEEGLIDMCACPAQVAETLRNVRRLYRYQLNCLENPISDPAVHTTIAEVAIATHCLLENCMEKLLELEQWDRATLAMPPDLRRRQAEEVEKEI